MWTTHSRAWERELVAECEAFLSGHMAQYLASKNRPIVAWAWLNALAHGSEDDVKACAAEVTRPRTSPNAEVWQEALSFLAYEVAKHSATRGCTIEYLQRSTLLPLELEIAGHQALSSLEPASLVASVLDALSQNTSGPTVRSP